MKRNIYAMISAVSYFVAGFALGYEIASKMDSWQLLSLAIVASAIGNVFLLIAITK